MDHIAEPAKLRTTLRSLMARTVANGCTEAEELTAARLAGRVAALLDGDFRDGGAGEAGIPSPPPERATAEYRSLLEKNVLESLLKAAIHELSLNHINLVSPPRRDVGNERVEQVDVGALLESHLVMMLEARSTVARDIIARILEELMLDGQLPAHLAVPVRD